jgi:hypothetical protein
MGHFVNLAPAMAGRLRDDYGATLAANSYPFFRLARNFPVGQSSKVAAMGSLNHDA